MLPGEMTPDEPNAWQPPPGFPPWQQQMPPWQPPPNAPAPRRGVPRWLVALVLAVLLVSYGAVVFVTKDIWRAGQPGHAVHASLSVQSLPGTSATPDALDRTRKALAERLRHIGGHKVTVGLDGNVLKVSATNVTEAQLRSVTNIGQLHIRPVIHAIASQFKGTPSNQVSAGTPDAQRIADEKALRQSAQPQIQLLALQFQATRCGRGDVLADNDDPNLPLVTCSSDGKSVYLLDKSIIGGDQVKDASARWSDKAGGFVVFITFDEKAAETWSTFTAANVGARTAFTIDTQVVSAPELREAMTTGRTQIHANFTGDTARAFAAVAAGGPLPVPVSIDSVQISEIPPPVWTLPRIAVLGGGVVVVFAVILGAVLMTRRASRYL